ncbi:uncharacterized protein LACBIDRAFT_310695 [Laccaria bicolor S238N-H82]|uniref:Predicted protein n=1 Tax=Laccaria bicolor (strain S238N-H82 / ATCC MYA-4686) TaxID=486041 RepID=B0DUX0_LACBS|nr:uncharacterized protein LACBIDRAFT_310695 [Laccaria bicolor S238N-H82]EDR01618.1 predicted protein [Laccaria bicolor S238N-H82]|eukprot:XP_001887694.1 predicted protein [Laccaria bicolor S238N-H82]
MPSGLRCSVNTYRDCAPSVERYIEWGGVELKALPLSSITLTQGPFPCRRLRTTRKRPRVPRQPQSPIGAS